MDRQTGKRKTKGLGKHSPTYIPGEREHCSYLQTSYLRNWHGTTTPSRAELITYPWLKERSESGQTGFALDTTVRGKPWPGPDGNYNVKESYFPFVCLVVDKKSSKTSIFQHTEP